MAIFTKADLNSEQPQQRIKALEKLDATTNQESFIKVLLEDDNIQVKEFALSKIDDSVLLASNLNNLTTNMQMASSARIVALMQLDVIALEVKKATLDQVGSLSTTSDSSQVNIPNTVLISYIFDTLIKEYDNEEISLYILEIMQKLPLPKAEFQVWMTKFVVNSESESVQIMALELIDEEEQLQQIINSSKKNNKKVRKIAQARSQDLKQEKLRLQELKLRCHKIALSARELSLAPFDSLLKKRYKNLQSSWLEASANASVEDKYLFTSCMEDVKARIDAEEQILNAQKEAEEQLIKINACVDEAKKLFNQFSKQGQMRENEIEQLQSKLDELENSFIHLPNIDLALTQEFNINVAKLSSHINANQAYLSEQSNIEQIYNLSDAEFLEAGEAFLNKVNWQDDFAMPKELKTLHDKIGKVKKKLKV